MKKKLKTKCRNGFVEAIAVLALFVCFVVLVVAGHNLSKTRAGKELNTK